MKVIRWPYGGNKEQGELGRSVLRGLLYGNYIGIATDVTDHPTFFSFFFIGDRFWVREHRQIQWSFIFFIALFIRVLTALKILDYIGFLLTLARHDSPQFSRFIGGVNRRPQFTYFKLRNSPLEFISRKIDIILFEKLDEMD